MWSYVVIITGHSTVILCTEAHGSRASGVSKGPVIPGGLIVTVELKAGGFVEGELSPITRDYNYNVC